MQLAHACSLSIQALSTQEVQLAQATRALSTQEVQLAPMRAVALSTEAPLAQAAVSTRVFS